MKTGSKVFDVLCGKWVIVSLGTLLVLMICAMLVLMWIERSRYQEAGASVETALLETCENIPLDKETIVWCPLYEADTVLLISKNSQTGSEFRYLTNECAKEVETILNESPADMVMFWLRSNYEILSFYELRDLNGIDNIELKNNYFARNGQIGFTLKKEQRVTNHIKMEVIAIK